MALSAPHRGLQPGDMLLVVHDFDARGTDELTLRRGEKIELVELDDGFGDGWYLGKDSKTGSTGLFPGVYTTYAPNLSTQGATNDADTKANQETVPGLDSLSDANTLTASPVDLSAPKSGESTPHASRHASASDMHPPDLDQAQLPPKQTQRASSSPLPSGGKMAVDIQQSIRQTMDGHLNGQGQDSPVMNETLSVIDEHITDLSTPRHSVAASQEQKTTNDSASEYSAHFDHRMSYINGNETDEEEENQVTEEQVRHWNPTDTAKHLRHLGVEGKHCDIFEEQEIPGEVLLDMDQDFIFMKEFDFGVMGRRLKTWHKIKAFQEDVRGFRPQRQSSRGSGSGFAGPPEERSLSRAGHTGPFLPRIPNLRGSVSSVQHPRFMTSSVQSNTSSPITSQTASLMDHSRKPSAASVREINHSRRHSSIDTTNRFSSAADGQAPMSHQKNGSFDRTWTMNTGSQRLPARPGTALGSSSNEAALPQDVLRGTESNGSDSAIGVADDLDRGYFSGPEGDTNKHKRLQKRSSVAGSLASRQSSLPEEKYRLNINQRHSRIGSADSIRDIEKRSSGMRSFHNPQPKTRFRSLSIRQNQPASKTPDEKSTGFFSAFNPFSGKSDSQDSTPRPSPMPLQQVKNAGPKFKRAMGLRAMSDIAGKGGDTSSPAPSSPIREVDPAPARTGSTTPSTSKSSERLSTDGSGKAVDGGIAVPRARASMRAGGKSKKDTSAYTRGLEKKTPQEQMKGCDYSGWMKKRSSNLMTTWKPRLFVLRGRRLSYYYSETDTEERGLIDITAHRVLRADHDPIIALHATITGSTASPTPGNSNNTETGSSEKASAAESSLKAPKFIGEGPFFFKLVPPKSGTSRTVQFTKPAIHYFQVDNVQEGRLWMAALMKATIDRNMELPVESTNKQRTISLKEARLMNQRPPALMAGSTTTHAEDREEEKSEQTLTPSEGLSAPEAPEKNEKRLSNNPLGGLDTGPTSLLPESIAKADE